MKVNAPGLIGALTLISLANLGFGQTSPTQANTNRPPDPQQAVDALVNMHRAWGAAASSPGAVLVAKESFRSGAIIKLRLYATGVPRPGSYVLVNWPVTQRGPSQVLNGVTLDESGMAICAGTPGTCGSSNKPNDPIDMALQPVPGEPARLGLITSDQSVKVFVKIVPIPVKGEDKGCDVQSTVLTPGSEVLLIEGSGFAPNADLTMDSESDGERHGGKVKADADGRYSAAILPYVQGKTRGMTKVTLRSAECAPTLNVAWGRRN